MKRPVTESCQNGSTLQLGIGTIPDAVLSCLGDKKDLGIHSEMISDGVIDLVDSRTLKLPNVDLLRKAAGEDV